MIKLSVSLIIGLIGVFVSSIHAADVPDYTVRSMIGTSGVLDYVVPHGRFGRVAVYESIGVDALIHAAEDHVGERFSRSEDELSLISVTYHFPTESREVTLAVISFLDLSRGPSPVTAPVSSRPTVFHIPVLSDGSVPADLIRYIELNDSQDDEGAD